ncbi:hypothetical protein TNCV_3252041 [Trichonephila clavipes]|nr:hypothetical protein TNCV_3252041 [Trichonephila clavipes]
MRAYVIIYKHEISPILSVERSRSCTADVKVPLYVKVHILVCNDACPDRQITSTIMVLFDKVLGPISTLRFFPDENTSRETVQTGSRLTIEENPSPIIICPRQDVIQFYCCHGPIPFSQKFQIIILSWRCCPFVVLVRFEVLVRTTVPISMNCFHRVGHHISQTPRSEQQIACDWPTSGLPTIHHLLALSRR